MVLRYAVVMSAQKPALNKTTLCLSILLGLSIPGSSLLFANKLKLAFSVPVLGLLWVCILSFSRVVTSTEGFVALLTGLLTLHVVVYIVGVVVYVKQSCSMPLIKTLGLSALLFQLTAAITISCHVYKDKWFGFAFYHIPSESMSPTLKTGDVVLIDSWVYNKQKPAEKDIIIFNRPDKNIVMAKRIKTVRSINSTSELFVEGDNSHHSLDSRNFGWINSINAIGKVNFVWFSMADRQRYFIATQ